MQLSKRKAKLVQKVLTQWHKDQILSEEEYDRLQHAYEIRRFDWRRLGKYCFFAALFCFVLALINLFNDGKLIRLLIKWQLFRPSFCLAYAILIAIGFYSWGFYRYRHFPSKIYSNEAILALGAIFTTVAIAILGDLLQLNQDDSPFLFLLNCIIYGALGFWFRSGLLWFLFLSFLGIYFGAETGYRSGWKCYWFGMNYPLRFVIFGSVLIAAIFLIRPILAQRNLYKVTQVMGLLYLFMALWMLSIFGNYDPDLWTKASQIDLLCWCILFGIVALGAIGIGLWKDNNIWRGFGITFLVINLYTRFFEYYWNSMNKIIFFFLAGLGFWLIGHYSEKIWNIGISNQLLKKINKKDK